MSYIEDGLDEVRRMTPVTGVNVCIYDDYEDIGEKLTLLEHFDTVEEAEKFMEEYDGDAELVMYEAETLEETNLSDKYASYSTQKNHNINTYIDMAIDDYKNKTNRTNDKYENTNYGKIEEKLNKDGTGVARARRGVNPNKTPHKVLQFMYVSKSDCDICKQYDGISFPLDSPNRPVIPRLESVSSRSKRPYTHPNCKCKWIIPISDIGYQNLIQARGGEAKSKEDYKSTYNKILDVVKKENPDFDKLSKSEKNWLIIDQSVKMITSKEVYTTSITNINFDSIQPVILSDLHKNGNEVRNMIDGFVGEALSEQEKRDIIEEHNLDFTFENLIDIVSESLVKKIANEGGVGSGKKGHQKWMRGAYAGEECPNCMIRTEKKDGKCAICGI